MLILKIIAFILLLLILLLVILIVMPIHYVFRGAKKEGITVEAKIFGPLRWFNFVFSIRDMGRQQKLKLLGFNMDFKNRNEDKGNSQKDKQRKATDEKKVGKKREKRIKSNKVFIKNLLREIPVLWRHIRPRRVDVQGIYGFDDPYHTGVVLGILSCLAINNERYNIDVIPTFDNSLLEGNVIVEGYVVPMFLIVLVIRAFMASKFKRIYDFMSRNRGKKAVYNE